MRRKLFIAVIIFTLGIVTMYSYQKRADANPIDYYIGQNADISGRITSIERKSDDRYNIIIDTGKGNIMCSYFSEIDNYEDMLYSEVYCRAKLEKPEKPSNPRAFDYALYLKSKGIFYVADISSFKVTSSSMKAFDRIRKAIFARRNVFVRELPLSEDAKGMIQGILFGDTNYLDESVYEEFRKNSTAHILAVSGLHLGIIYSLYRIINKKRKSKTATILFGILILIYGTATLWAVSVTRAASLIFITVIGNALDRRYDLLTAASLIALILIIRNPYIVFGASFQMSFLAVASIGFITPFLERFMDQTFAGILSVQLGMIPYMMYTFNGISLIGIIVNIPVVFLISMIVPAGVLCFFLFLLTGGIIPIIPVILEGLVNLTAFINHIFGGTELFYCQLPSMKLGPLIFIYGMIFFITSEFFYVCINRKRYYTAAVCICAICAVSAVSTVADYTPFDRAKVVFVDVGQGDCLHIKGDKNINILVDGGGKADFNIGQKTIKPYLLKNGIGEINLALATHLHTDHYLGLKQLSEDFDVKKLVTKGNAGDCVMIDENSSISVLWPLETPANTEDENLNSMVFKIVVDGISVLVTGDITEEGERMLLQKYKGTDILKSDVLKVAHHGSSYSSCEDFIENVSPKIAVISVGKRNNYGHPAPDTIERLEKFGAAVYRTDQDGAVGVFRHGDKIGVCTMK